jgi:dihydroorotase-like cyclic amidohydrolase
MLDLIIKGGQVVTPQDAAVMDVGVQGDKIVAVGWPGTLAADAARVIDATGKIVVPGGIEPHAHIGIPVPEHWAGTPDVFTQPPEAASRAAAFGGVTTVIDFAGTLALDPAKTAKRESILDVLETRRSMFRGHSYTDFAFHYILAGEVAAATVGQIGEAIQEGVASFKIFTTFRPIRVPYGHLWSIFSEVAKLLGPDSAYRFVLPEGKQVITSVLAVGLPHSKNDLGQRFVDYMASAEAQEAFCLKIVCSPPHPKAQPPSELKAYRPPPELIYAPDWDLINKNLPAWDDRFKKEIQTR